MATVKICDYEGCGRPLDITFTGAAGEYRYKGEFCSEHWDDMAGRLAAIGLTVTHAKETVARVDVYYAENGRPYTTREARAWLVEQGLIKHGPARLSVKNRELYAKHLAEKEWI